MKKGVSYETYTYPGYRVKTHKDIRIRIGYPCGCEFQVNSMNNLEAHGYMVDAKGLCEKHLKQVKDTRSKAIHHE